MLLTDREIAIALRTGELCIEPPPPSDWISSTAVDLSLGAEGLTWTPLAKGFTIRPGHKNYRYSEAARFQSRIAITGYVLCPNAFVLGWTAEKIQLPNNSRLAARVEGKSNLARLGIGIHVTAPTIHAGYGEPKPQSIQLEICNFGPHDVVLDAGMKICQLIIEQTLGTPEKGYQPRQLAGI